MAAWSIENSYYNIKPEFNYQLFAPPSNTKRPPIPKSLSGKRNHKVVFNWEFRRLFRFSYLIELTHKSKTILRADTDFVVIIDQHLGLYHANKKQ